MSAQNRYPWQKLNKPGASFTWYSLADEMNLRSAACKYAKRKGIVIQVRLLDIPRQLEVTLLRNRPLQ